MEIKTISSNFPDEIASVIIEILKHTVDGVEIRDRLISIFNDSWIVIQGKQFAYLVSRASKSAGMFNNKSKGLKFLIYTPPFTELTPYIPDLPVCEGKWNVILVKKTPSDSCPLITAVFEYLKTLDYSDSSKSAELLKRKVNSLEEKFWHVVVGSDFVCTLPCKDVEYLLYCKAKQNQISVDIVIFRKQGVQKKVNWSGLLTGTIYICMTFIFFLGIFGLLKCDDTSQTWLCRNHKTLLYIGLAFVFSKASKSILRLGFSKTRA